MTELRLAVRRLCASPVITVVAVLSLGLGIGANTAIFSLVNSLILRPLPVVEPQRLAIVSDTRAGRQDSASWTYAMWDAIQKHTGAFDGACAWFSERLNLAEGGGQIEPAEALWVSGRYFETLGVPAIRGRTITAQDDARNGSNGAVAVISYRLWQLRFGGAEDVIGRRLVIERLPFTIVGVTPASFFGAEVGRAFDVALPMNTEPLIAGRPSRIDPQGGLYALTVLLRLKPSQSTDAATALLRGVQPQIRRTAMPAQLPPAFQKEFMKDPFIVIPAGTGTSQLRLQYRQPLLVIMIVVALVLLIACANIANLQFARAVARRHDASVRLALGAPRWQLIRQSMLESLLLSVAGALLALLVAATSSRAIVSGLSAARERLFLDVSLDWRVLLFTGTVAIVTTLLSGLLPAIRASRASSIDALKDQARTTTDVRSGRLSGGLVVAQVALSIVIVVAAGLFVQSFRRLASVPPGFDADRVLLVNVSLARANIAPPDRVPFIQRLVREIAAVPGATRVAASLVTPIQGGGMVDLVRVPGGTTSMMPMQGDRLGERSTFANAITPGWFSTYGTPLEAGRDFNESDLRDAPSVIIVNEAFVRKFLRDVNPIGSTVAFDGGRPMPLLKTVVGVVGDAAYDSLRARELPVEYVPLPQLSFPGGTPTNITLNVRAAVGSPMLLVRSISAAVTAVNPDLVFTFRPMSGQLSASLVQDQLVAVLSGFFGLLALLLAGLGLYGVTAYAVASRRAEIGIRMALGSSGRRVRRLVLSRVARMVGAGIVIGIGASVWASTFVASLLFGIEPRDMTTLAGAAVVLTALALIATWPAALRASRLDPASVLREG